MARYNENWYKLMSQRGRLASAIKNNEEICKTVGSLKVIANIHNYGAVDYNFDKEIKLSYKDIDSLMLCSIPIIKNLDDDVYETYFFNCPNGQPNVGELSKDYIARKTQESLKKGRTPSYHYDLTPMEVARLAKKKNKLFKAQLALLNYLLKSYDIKWEFFKFQSGFTLSESKRLYKINDRNKFMEVCQQILLKKGERKHQVTLEHCWKIKNYSEKEIKEWFI